MHISFLDLLLLSLPRVVASPPSADLFEGFRIPESDPSSTLAVTTIYSPNSSLSYCSSSLLPFRLSTSRFLLFSVPQPISPTITQLTTTSTPPASTDLPLQTLNPSEAHSRDTNPKRMFADPSAAPQHQYSQYQYNAPASSHPSHPHHASDPNTNPFVLYSRSLHDYTLRLWTESRRIAEEKAAMKAMRRAEDERMQRERRALAMAQAQVQAQAQAEAQAQALAQAQLQQLQMQMQSSSQSQGQSS